MSLQQAKENYDNASRTASDVARQLAFAGIALIWIFKKTELNNPLGFTLPPELLLPSFFLASALAVDLLQYFYKALIFGWYHRKHEKLINAINNDRKRNEAAAGLRWPREFNWITIICFWSKLIFVLIAYAEIIKFISGGLNFLDAIKTLIPFI